MKIRRRLPPFWTMTARSIWKTAITTCRQRLRGLKMAQKQVNPSMPRLRWNATPAWIFSIRCPKIKSLKSLFLNRNPWFPSARSFSRISSKIQVQMGPWWKANRLWLLAPDRRNWSKMPQFRSCGRPYRQTPSIFIQNSTTLCAPLKIHKWPKWRKFWKKWKNRIL